jgi:hypothetical protein
MAEEEYELVMDHAPLVIQRWPSRPTEATYGRALDVFASRCQPGERYVILLDMRRFLPIAGSALQRGKAAAILDDQMAFWRKRLIGEVRLIAHPIVRAISTVFDWQHPLPWRVRHARTPEEAVRKCIELMDGAGLATDPALAELGPAL